MRKGTIIVGAGIAGLLAANMLHRREPMVVEAQPTIPNNHSAVLRFRSSVVGDALGIPFRRVSVVKSSLPWENPVADQLAYASKVSGVSRSDRSLPTTVERVERWIAPPNLIEQMADRVHVGLGHAWDFEDRTEKVISTIPMPTLAAALGYSGLPTFRWRGGVNLVARIEDCDAHATLYVPNPGVPYYRVSITGDQLIVEMAQDWEAYRARDESSTDIAFDAASLLGVAPNRVFDLAVKPQDYAKILPIDEGARRQFIYWASTAQMRAFSLGRFATWRPGLLADDLVKDVGLIDSWIDSGSQGYDQERHERERTR